MVVDRHPHDSSYQMTGHTTVMVGDTVTVAFGVMDVDIVVASVGATVAFMLLMGGSVVKLTPKIGDEAMSSPCTRLSS